MLIRYMQPLMTSCGLLVFFRRYSSKENIGKKSINKKWYALGKAVKITILFFLFVFVMMPKLKYPMISIVVVFCYFSSWKQSLYRLLD